MNRKSILLLGLIILFLMQGCAVYSPYAQGGYYYPSYGFGYRPNYNGYPGYGWGRGGYGGGGHHGWGAGRYSWGGHHHGWGGGGYGWGGHHGW
jgi:hypothetical protein